MRLLSSFSPQKEPKRYAQKDEILTYRPPNTQLPNGQSNLKLTQQQLKPLIKLLARNAAKRDYAILLKQHLQKTGAMPQKG